jgi:redox-sensitive bicupin YhaK (pirin superfamily)
VHGLQVWVALPDGREEDPPSFHHADAAALPRFGLGAAELVLVVGEAYGRRSPVPVASPLFELDVRLPAGALLELPDAAERAVYVVDGRLAGDHAAGALLVFAPGPGPDRIRAEIDSRVVVLGGAPVGERHYLWNFVSSSRARLEQAARDWRDGRFPKVPGDEVEYVPWPESLR